MNAFTRLRWGDNDRYFGPFTYSRDISYRHFAFTLGTGHSEEDERCRLRLSAFGHTVIVAMPQIVKPDRKWVDTSRYEWSKGPGSGYWDRQQREFGLSLFEGHLDIKFGRQTNDSSTEQRWGCFLPWTQWRFVRHSLYGLTGEHHWTDPHTKARGFNPLVWEDRQKAKDSCPAQTFAFKDFDGEELTAKTLIEEREWLLGEKWCSWLSLFAKPKIRRSLDINFSGETGRRKGSWKGGTMGTGINLLPGELHESGFRRYCAEHSMTFIGATA